MVGAIDIAEFAWAIENLLNKIIENTLQRSPGNPRHRPRRRGRSPASWWMRSRRVRRAPARAQAIVDRAHALAANKAGQSATTATMEILERTLETRRDDLNAATGRVPTLQAPEPQAAPAEPSAESSSIEDSMEVVEDWALNEQDGGGENIVLSAPEEDSQHRHAAARHLQPRNTGEHRRGVALRRD